MSGPQLDIESIEARSARIAAANVHSLDWNDIADARQDMPALCREVRQLREQLAWEKSINDGLALQQEGWEEWSNTLASMLPESYDDDAAQEAIIERFVRDSVAALGAAVTPTPQDEREQIRERVMNDPAALHDALDEVRALWKAALEREGNLASAVADLIWKATQFGTTEDGDTYSYIVPKGTMHRLVGVAQQNGAHVPVAFRSAAESSTPEAATEPEYSTMGTTGHLGVAPPSGLQRATEQQQ